MQAPITSPHNEKLKLLRRLSDRRGRRKEGLFAAEGEDLLALSLRAGVEPVLVLASAGQWATPEALGTDVITVEPELLDRVSALGSGTRLIAVWELPVDPAPPADDVLRVYLDGVSDPANVGAIVRTAEALCGARVIVGAGSADPYGPKAIRASMGAIFAQPPLAAAIEETPRPRLGLDAHDGGELEAAIASATPRTICLGAEREGLGAEAISACDALATIPVEGTAESLNVAATAAIVLHRISSTAPPGSPGNS